MKENVEGGPVAPMAPTVGQSISSLREFITQWAAGTREGHRFAHESQERADKVLTWTIGLMGAGILASKDFLNAVPLDVRFAALLPWVLGVITGVAARLLADHLAIKNNLVHYDRVHRMELLLLLVDQNEARVRKEIDEVLSHGGGLAERDQELRRLMIWQNVLFYASHLLLAIGIVAVVAAAYAAGRAAR